MCWPQLAGMCSDAEPIAFYRRPNFFVQLISALIHDIGHLGVNNQYLMEKAHELALEYNDCSPLENMSVAKMFEIAKAEEQDIFSKVESITKKTMRKEIIETVLCTDVTKHKSLMNQVALFYQLNSGELSKGKAFLSPKMSELFTKESQMFQKLLLHLADNSVPTKPWALCYRYASLEMEECFAQGRFEKDAGMPVQILCNADKVSRHYVQVGWISHVVLPMVEVVAKVFPSLDSLGENLGHNFEQWMKAFQEETRPTEDEAWQQGERIRMVAQRCEDMRSYATFIEDGPMRHMASKESIRSSAKLSDRARDKERGV